MDREPFLARIRERSRAPVPEPPPAPSVVRRGASLDRFAVQLERVGGRCDVVAKDQVAARAIAIASERGLTTFAAWTTPSLDAVREALRAFGLTEIGAPGSGRSRDLRAALEVAEMGVVEADFAISETGTIGILSGRDRPRLVSCLPRVLVAVLGSADLLERIEDAPCRFASRALPSSIALMTGVSCTGDIEGRLLEGAHGPAALHVIVARSS